MCCHSGFKDGDSEGQMDRLASRFFLTSIMGKYYSSGVCPPVGVRHPNPLSCLVALILFHCLLALGREISIFNKLQRACKGHWGNRGEVAGGTVGQCIVQIGSQPLRLSLKATTPKVSFPPPRYDIPGLELQVVQCRKVNDTLGL